MTRSRPRASAPAFSQTDFRAALATFATGVTIVTARDAAGQPVGITANSFNSVSLSPPLVLWSLARRAGSMPVFSRGSHYAINILAADQRTLAERFASKTVGRDGLTGLERARMAGAMGDVARVFCVPAGDLDADVATLVSADMSRIDPLHDEAVDVLS